MGNWRDVAAAAAHGREPAEVVGSFGLPDDLAAALRRLEAMQAPQKLENAANWRGVVADALALARDGWAANALALGWTTGDLFGIGPRDDCEFQGLAIWLASRRIIMLDEKMAIVADASGERRAIFNRGGMRHGTQPAVDPVMLWDFGRG